MLTTNLETKLVAANRRAIEKDTAVLAQEAALQSETDKLVDRALNRATEEVEREKTAVMTSFGFSYKLAEAANVRTNLRRWAGLPRDRIFSSDTIKELCIRYDLRFLRTDYYKGSLDAGLPEKLTELKALGFSRLPDFYIAAPASSFALQKRPVDPLLFGDLGDNHYLLVHKWGHDISVFRSLRKHLFRAVFFAAAGIGVFAGWKILDAGPIGIAHPLVAALMLVVSVFTTIGAVWRATNLPRAFTTEDNWRSHFLD